ncbi:prepilin peptidase [Burkholderia cenocepacia]|uniref:prepilin peptidase n=1 Tax=Burkholderia cenocepacia TaxID=95486 RepID=UPI00265156C8|nr:A24 family peptidase [Burkholderia cenocepacia]MDN7452320.1 A24 family peptidase [Burkholderia cenocepacia]
MAFLSLLILGIVAGTGVTLATALLSTSIEREAHAAAVASGDTHCASTDVATHCASCGRSLAVLERLLPDRLARLIPRCRDCAERLVTLFPLVCIVTTGAALCSRLVFGLNYDALAAFAFVCTLVAASVIDIRHRLLPDAITLPLLWAGLIVNLNGTFASLDNAVIGAAVGYLVLWLPSVIFRLLRGVDGMGHGDFKLLAALGAWLGWQSIPWIVALSTGLCAVAGIALIFAQRIRADTTLPFGPFLVCGGLVALYFRDWILTSNVFS